MSLNKHSHIKERGNKQNELVHILTSITGIVIISKLFGFVKQIVMANAFGATIETDLVSLSQGLYGNIEYVIAQVFTTAFVSIYIYIKSIDSEKSKQFISDIIKLMVGGSCIIAVVIAGFSPLISRIIAPSYNDELCKSLTFYIIIFSPILIVFSITAVFQAILNANNRYIPCQIIGLNQSIITVAFILALSSKIGIWSFIISSFIYPIWNALYLLKKSYPYLGLRKESYFKSKEILQFIMMMGPLFVGYSMIFVNQQVDKILVSGLGDGVVTAMGYGAVLSNLVITLIASFCTVFFTRLTEKISINDNMAVTIVFNKAIFLLITIFLPVSIITILCAKEIVMIAFGRGEFGNRAISNAAMALMGYGFIFVPNSLKNLCSRYMYGKKDSKTPMLNSSLAIIMNIIMSILLVRKLGIFGITFASSMAEGVCAFLNMTQIKKQIFSRQINDSFQKQVVLWITGGGVCAILCVILKHITEGIPIFIRFIVVCIVSLIGYIICVYPMLIREIKIMYKEKE